MEAVVEDVVMRNSRLRHKRKVSLINELLYY